MNYNVGQILYIVFKKDNKVIPGQIFEEVTKKTLDGVKVDYNIRIGSDDKTTITLDEIDGDVFDAPDVAIEVLSERAKSSITRLVNLAAEKAKTWYGPKKSEQRSKSLKDEVSKKLPLEHEDDLNNISESQIIEPTAPQEEIVSVKMPDGSVVKAKMPKTA